MQSYTAICTHGLHRYKNQRHAGSSCRTTLCQQIERLLYIKFVYMIWYRHQISDVNGHRMHTQLECRILNFVPKNWARREHSYYYFGVPVWVFSSWRTAGASRCSSWCRTAQSCWSGSTLKDKSNGQSNYVQDDLLQKGFTAEPLYEKTPEIRTIIIVIGTPFKITGTHKVYNSLQSPPPPMRHTFVRTPTCLKQDIHVHVHVHQCYKIPLKTYLTVQ